MHCRYLEPVTLAEQQGNHLRMQGEASDFDIDAEYDEFEFVSSILCVLFI
jgi:hypothetical protein